MKQNKWFVILIVLALIVPMLSGCGQGVSVPGACVAKVKTSSGYQDDIRRPSSFRLPFKGFGAAPELVIAEVSDQQVEETMQVFMPKDQLILTFDVRGIGMVSADPEKINTIFDRVAAEPVKDQANVYWIDFGKIYAVYGQQAVRTRCRELITSYDIMYILSNQEAVSNELFAAVSKELEGTPIGFSSFGLSKVLPPDVIVRAQEQAKEREIAIRRAEADKLVKLTEAEAALEVARKQQEVDLTEAETQVMVERKMNDVVSPAFAMQRGFKVLQTLGENGNLIVFMPYEAMNNPAMMTGVLQQALNQGLKQQAETSTRGSGGN